MKIDVLTLFIDVFILEGCYRSRARTVESFWKNAKDNLPNHLLSATASFSTAG